MHRSNPSSSTPPRYRLLFLLGTFLLLLIFYILYHSHKSISSIALLPSNSIHSVELTALRKRRGAVVAHHGHDSTDTTSSSLSSLNHGHDHYHYFSRKKYGFLKDGFDPFLTTGNREQNCSEFIQRFDWRNSELNKNTYKKIRVHHDNLPPLREQKRKYILEKWSKTVLPEALVTQLLTYKSRVLLKMFHGQNQQLWKPLREATYRQIYEKFGRSNPQHQQQNNNNMDYHELNTKIEQLSTEDKWRLQQEFSLSVMNHHHHVHVNDNEAEEKCYIEFPECSVWSQPDVQLFVTATRNSEEDHHHNNNNENNNMMKTNPELHNIPEFNKNSKIYLENGRKHLLNFVDLFMNAKCCIEHRQLKKALRGTFKRLAQIRKVPLEQQTTEMMDFSGASLTAGSLLASVREEGYFIPWDTDIDILIQEKDENLVRKFLFQNNHVKRSGIHNNKNDNNNAEEENENNEKQDDISSSSCCFTKLLDPPRQVDHGRLLGYVYSTPSNVKPHHEEESRVEVWVSKNDKKMQKNAIVLPHQVCSLQEVGDDEEEDDDLKEGGGVMCPKFPEKVLKAGYGEKWCVACKSKSSNCKN